MDNATAAALLSQMRPQNPVSQLMSQPQTGVGSGAGGGGGGTPAGGTGIADMIGAALRRLGGMSGARPQLEQPGMITPFDPNAGASPADTTAQVVPGDHLGLSELSQGSLLDQIVRELSRGQIPGSKPDMNRQLLPNALPGYDRGRIGLLPNSGNNMWSRSQTV